MSFLEEKLGDKPSLEQLNQYSEVKQELEHIFLEKVKGSAIRSRAEFIENNGRNSIYFLALEKKNFNLKCIKCLNTKHGQITDESKILKEEHMFYEKLYTAPMKQNDENLDELFISNEKIKTLTNEDRQICDAPISVEECKPKGVMDSLLNSINSSGTRLFFFLLKALCGPIKTINCPPTKREAS